MRNGHKWIIVLVAWDDPEIETRVIKERIAVNENEQLAAFLRGGALIEVLDLDDESAAEGQRVAVEKSCLQ